MGRWFGYRDGYEDLTRLYTTSDLAEWFEYISKAMAELRIQFRVMANYGATPINFGLKVKSHPLLMVTSNVKMRHGHELETNFVDHFSQMVTFDLKTIKENLGLTNEFLSSMKEPDERDLIVRKNLFNERNSFVWRDIESTKVISFLSKFKTHEDAKSVKPYLYSEFIKNMNNSGELMNWTIGLMGAGRSKYLFRIADKYQVELAIRKPRKNSNEKKFSIGVLTDPKHEGLDLSAEQIKEALSKSGGLKNLGANFRQQRDRKNGLLLLYPVLTCYSDSDYNDAKKAKEKSDYQGIPSVGFAVSFPSNSKVSPENMNVRYVVNNIYHKEEFQSSSS